MSRRLPTVCKLTLFLPAVACAACAPLAVQVRPEAPIERREASQTAAGPSLPGPGRRGAEDSPQRRTGEGPGLRRSPPEAAPVPPSRRIPCSEVVRMAREVGTHHGLDPALLVGIAYLESAFIENAISRAQAVGLAQVLPSNGKALACGDLFHAPRCLECGARVLVGFLKRYDGKLLYALAGYNGGNAYAGPAARESRVPANLDYAVGVLRHRARFLRMGCAAFGEGARKNHAN